MAGCLDSSPVSSVPSLSWSETRARSFELTPTPDRPDAELSAFSGRLAAGLHKKPCHPRLPQHSEAKWRLSRAK